MRRRGHTLALACISAISFAQREVIAQTWLNPTTGSWSLGSNWIGGIAPVSSATTQLRFSAISNQSYIATNDFVGPFVLNRVTLDGTSSSAIHLNGSALSFAGAAPAIVQTGAGVAMIDNALTLPSTGGQDAFPINATNLVLAGSLTSSVAPTDIGGAYVNLTGVATLSAGANLFALAMQSGTLNITAGTYNLTSTRRRNDPIGANNGPWSLSIGEADDSVSMINQTGGTILARQGFINVGSHTTGAWNISGPNTLANFDFGIDNTTAGRFGILGGTATMNITNGATVQGRLFEIGRGTYDESPVQIVVNLDGPGSRVHAHQCVVSRVPHSNVTMNVTNGGVMKLTSVGQSGSGALLIALAGDTESYLSTATLNVNGANSMVECTGVTAGTETAAGYVNVTGGGTIRVHGDTMIGAPGLGAKAAIGDGTLLVNGLGSLFDSEGQAVLGGSTTLYGALNHAHVTVSGGASMRVGMLKLAESSYSGSVLVVEGAATELSTTATPLGGTDWFLSQGMVAESTLNIRNGSRAVTQGSVFAAAGQGSSATINLSAAAWSIRDEFRMGWAAGGATLTVSNSGILSVGSLTVDQQYSRLNYNAGTINSVGTLNVLGASVVLSSGHDKLLDVGGCSISSNGVIDLNDNSLLVRGGQPMQQIESFITAGRNGGPWDGTNAITSSAARTNPLHNTTLGVMRGDQFLAVYGPGATFYGRVVSPSDVLVDYTYYGDTDLNGVINFDDYARLDAGFNNHRTGWFNGDFDLNGVINFDDYSLIDYAFNSQSVRPALHAVPEPASLFALVSLSMRSRRRRITFLPSSPPA